MDAILQDVRYALRQFAARPGFAVVAVLSLALGIGGNSAIYGLVDGFVLNPFPYPQPDRLVSIGVTFPKLSSETRYVEALSPAEYADIRHAPSLSRTAAFDLGNRNVAGGDIPERVFTALLLDDLFPVVGLKPALGRGFTPGELAPGGPRVAIISFRLWHSRFGGDPNILSRTIRIGGEPAAIVGVMPPELLLIGTDLWIPWGGDQASMPRNVRPFTVLARLGPGATAAKANADLATIAGRTAQAEGERFKEYADWALTATPWASALMQDIRPVAFLLLGAVGLVLLIACANLASLLLARSTTRQRELAVRVALGAGRARLASQMVTESLLLALGGAAGGLLLAYMALRSAEALIPPQMAMLGLHADLNARVMAFGIALAVGAGLLVALLPVMHATRADAHESLKADARTAGSLAGSRVRHALVVAEMALSVVLLLGAGLLMRSFLNLNRVELGFEPRGVLTMRLTLPREKYPEEAANVFFDRVTDRIGQIAGVRSVSAASQFPPMGAFSTQFALERGEQTGPTLPTALITVASSSYFETIGVPLLAGRRFAATDRLSTPPVAIVNRAFTDRYFPGVDPLGQRIRILGPDEAGRSAEIVGVVADFRNEGAARPVRPEIFVPMHQQTMWNQLFVLVRGSIPGLAGQVRQAVASLDPEQPVYAVRTLEEAVATASFQQRIATVLLALFAGVALTLAAIGVYGVMAYSVSARTREMGVRLAIGASPRNVIWLVLRQVLVLSAIGLGIGTAVLLAAGKTLSGLLFGVAPNDPLTIGGVAAALGAVALGAAWLPAFRASRVDPLRTLRSE